MIQHAPATPELAHKLYYDMLLIRRVEERIKGEYHHQEMRSPAHLYMGQEAVAAGVCAALRKDDLIFPYYRSHGWYLAKGGSLDAMMAELYGKATGCSRGWGGSMHLIDIDAGVMGSSAIVGGMVPHAAGAALALRMKGTDAIAMVPFGDGASEEGGFHETLNFASLRKLPMFFVVENNTYAVHTHLRERQPQPDIWRHAESYALPGVLVDGNDVAAVYEAAQDAADRARSGGGPTLIEARTYRVLEHCGPLDDVAVGYRTEDEINFWKSIGPFEKGRLLVSDEEKAAMLDEIESRVDDAFLFAKRSPFPSHVFQRELV